ncbi:right-handed parallel beta-helix repeat-containing protein [Pseudochelatococcus lubricantis]|uniref:right-handed parallel beta-helix repeat-containing protein n=1 Tax=Pseudochelatococcus lubricantis TaxID=1538102 RepID=UPI0035E54C71
MTRRRRLNRSLVGAALVAGAVLSAPATASLDGEADRAAAIVRDSVLALDGETNTRRRAALLRPAIEAFDVLTALADKANSAGAARAAAALAAQAVTADILRLAFVEALIDAVSKTDETLDAEIETKAVLLAIGDPAYRAAGWTALARRMRALGQNGEAERLAARAIEDARRIDRPQTRDGALGGAVFVFDAANPPAALLTAATDAISAARARADIFRRIARARLQPAGAAPDDGELAAASAKHLAEKRPAEALFAAQAMSQNEPRRQEALKRIFDGALAEGDEATALRAAKSMDGDKAQDDAVARVVSLMLDRDAPLRAADIAALTVRPGARASTAAAIARKLNELGYRDAGLGVLAATRVPAQETKAAAALAVAFADFSRFDEARALSETIDNADDRSYAFSRLARRLAEAGDIGEARGMLDLATRPQDASFARAGIARALAKTGDIGGATALLDPVFTDEDRVRVSEAIGRALANAGRFGEAGEVAAAIPDAAARARTFAVLASRLGEANRDGAIRALELALDSLGDSPAPQEHADIAVAFAAVGEQARADAILQGVTDGQARSEAHARIARRLLGKGALDAARAQAALAPLPAVRDAVLAETAVAAHEKDGDLERFVAEVRTLAYRPRVGAMRRVAERRAGALDRFGWLDKTPGEPLKAASRAYRPRDIRFVSGGHVVRAPAPVTAIAHDIRMPDIAALNAASQRAAVPYPGGGSARAASIRFSPLDPDALGGIGGQQADAPANTAWPFYLAVESGTLTLGQIARDLPEAGARDMLRITGDRVLVRAPVVVLPGATLVMSGAEFARYRLSADAGAFIAVAGRLIVQDAEIASHDEATGEPIAATGDNRARFRPYITAWGGGDIRIAGSRLAMLGYDQGRTAGLSFAGGPAASTGRIVDNSFENLRYGLYSREAGGVDVVGNEFRDSAAYGVNPHDGSRGMLLAFNTAHGTQEKHGIFVSRDVRDTLVVGNVALANAGSGIVLERASRDNVIVANSALRNAGDGLAIYESGCNLAVANDISGNRRAGVRVRNSSFVGLYDNRIADNKDSGARIYAAAPRSVPDGDSEAGDVQPVSTAALTGNAFIANRSAIDVTDVSELILDGNRFEGQRGRIFTGDLLPLTPFLLQIGDRSDMLVSRVCQPPRPSATCRFGAWPQAEEPVPACTDASTAKGSRDG